MRTETVTIYKFSELSEKGKKTAIENHRENYTEFFWVDEWMQSVKKGLEAFGAKLKNWDIDCQNINCSSWQIENHNDNTEQMTGRRLRTWLLNNYSHNFSEAKHYGEFLPKEKRKGNKYYPYYSKIQKVKTECPFTGYCGDEYFLDVFREFIKKPDGRTLDELLEDATEKAFRGMERDCEWQLSDEYISEELEANNYEFTEDGEQY